MQSFIGQINNLLNTLKNDQMNSHKTLKYPYSSPLVSNLDYAYLIYQSSYYAQMS
jgi:hypothetical protein